MKQACVVIADLDDGTSAMSVVFDGGFDKTSPAHCAMRRVLEEFDKLGMCIIEPADTGDGDGTQAVPEPLLLDGSGNTIIPV